METERIDFDSDSNEKLIRYLKGQYKKKHNKEFAWRDPTIDEVESIAFQAVWEVIQGWSMNVPEVDGNFYRQANSNHVVAILDALKHAIAL